MYLQDSKKIMNVATIFHIISVYETETRKIFK
jgi:hypothetical protein